MHLRRANMDMTTTQVVTSGSMMDKARCCSISHMIFTCGDITPTCCHLQACVARHRFPIASACVEGDNSSVFLGVVDPESPIPLN